MKSFTTTIDEKVVLAVKTGFTTANLKARNIPSLKSEKGWVYREGKILEWKPESFFEKSGLLYFYGHSNSPLEGALLSDKQKLSSQNFVDLLLLLKALSERGEQVNYFSENLIYILKSGGILLLPRRIVEASDRQISEELQVKHCYPFRHPQKEPLTFALGALFYREITGRLPYDGKTREEIERRMRWLTPLPLDQLIEGFDGELSLFITKNLKTSESTLSDWFNRLPKWNPQLFTRQKLSPKSTTLFQKEESFFKKQEFKRRYGSLMLGGAAGAFLLALLLGSMIKNITAPPPTVGLPREVVVSLFYQAIEELDTEIISAIARGKDGKAESKIISQLYVIGKVREGYEGVTPYISPDEWLKTGSPPLSPEKWIYGITELRITQLSDSTFQADYLYWTRSEVQEGKSYKPQPTSRRDILTLAYNEKRDFWSIEEIERTEW